MRQVSRLLLWPLGVRRAPLVALLARVGVDAIPRGAGVRHVTG